MSYNITAEACPSDWRGRDFAGHDRGKQNLYNRSYLEGDAHRRTSRFQEHNQYNQSYRGDVPDHPSGSGNNRYDAPYSRDSRQSTSYQKRGYMERPHWDNEMNMGAFSGNETPNRQRYMDKGGSQSYDDEWFPEENPSRGSYKSREGTDYNGNISDNRFGDSGVDRGQEYQEMRESVYPSHHRAGPSMDERQWQRGNLSYTEKGRDRFQDRAGRHGSFEMQDYNKRQQYYPTENDRPAKKKRKSRFSDASPLEMAHLQNR